MMRADGRRLTHWSQRVPISTWLNNIGVARFASRYFGNGRASPCKHGSSTRTATPESILRKRTRRAVEFFSIISGRTRMQKLADVESAGNRRIEHASAIFYGRGRHRKACLQSGRARDGAPVVRRFRHREGLGRCLAERGFRHLLRGARHGALRRAGRVLASMMRRAEQVFQTKGRCRGSRWCRRNRGREFPTRSYTEGVLGVARLARATGTEKFWAGIREYYRRYRDGNASTEDFRKMMRKSRSQDLGGSSASGYIGRDRRRSRAAGTIMPRRSGSNGTGADAGGRDVSIAAGGRGRDGGRRIEMTAARQRFDSQRPASPGLVILDPNSWILMQGTFGGALRRLDRQCGPSFARMKGFICGTSVPIISAALSVPHHPSNPSEE